MELFAITCATCHSRLKVRDRAIIQQIVGCPKCHAMVLVAPPEGWVDPGEQAAAEPAPVVKPPTLRARSAPPTDDALDGTFADAAALLEKPKATLAPPIAAKTHDEPATVAANSRRGLVLTIGGAVLAAVVVLAAGAYAVASWWRADAESSVADTGPVKNIAQPADNTSEEKVPPKPLVEPPTNDEKAPPEIAVKPADPQPADVPPDLVPRVGEVPPDEDPKPLDNLKVGELLEKFGPIVEEKPPAPVPSAEVAAPGIADAAVPTEELLPRPDARKVDVARRLADPLEAIEMKDVALADFLQFITDLTLVPVTLEPASLAAIKVSAETPISAKVQKTKVGELLAAALEPRGLTFVASDAGIVVLPAASAKDELTQVKYDVSDLAKSQADTESLAKLLQVAIDPATWKTGGGSGECSADGTMLAVTQSADVHFLIAQTLDKVRLAPKGAALPRAMAAQSILKQKLTLNFVPPTRLHRVLDRVKAATDLRVLVNWRAIAEEGWTPETEVKIGVANEPLEVLLERLTRRMQLAYRVIDEKTVQITTQADLAERPDVEVYPLATGSEALAEKFRAALGAERFADGTCLLTWHEESKSLVARLPQPLQRKLFDALPDQKN